MRAFLSVFFFCIWITGFVLINDMPWNHYWGIVCLVAGNDMLHLVRWHWRK